MTPQEKAIELIDKYKNYALSTGVDENNLSFDDLKQCALIAVDELLEECRLERDWYWDRVKTEIEYL
jgi:hypothetical protein